MRYCKTLEPEKYSVLSSSRIEFNLVEDEMLPERFTHGGVK